VAIVSVIVLLLLAFAYGGYRRTLNNQTAARDAGLPKGVTPATQAGKEFMQATPAGTVPMTRSHSDELHPPDSPPSPQATCGSDPRTGQPFRFNPQTRQSCNNLPQERVVVRQPNAVRTQPVAPTPIHEETPEEAIQAPTGVRNSATSSPTATTGQPATNALSQVEALSRALGARQSGDSVPLPNA
jgi:hypothetical protein